MVEVGYFLASETQSPDEIVEYAAAAEDAGFDFVVVSDHYHPWTRKQGESPFVWSVLGGMAVTTDKIPIGTAVTCPTIRIHPAILAQAAATTQELLDGRFFFGVGTGERLNEHILGDRWPPHRVRLEMLAEAMGIIRDLWSGEMITHYGTHYTVENARLFTVPEESPSILVSGLGPRTARAAGDIGDGLLTTYPDEDLVEAYQTTGAGPRYGAMRVCYAESVAAARETAYEWWPNTALTGVTQELALPQQFEAATEMVDEDDVAEDIVTGPDPEEYLADIEEYADAGYDHVYIHQIGPDQEAFLEFAKSQLLPRVQPESQ